MIELINIQKIIYPTQPYIKDLNLRLTNKGDKVGLLDEMVQENLADLKLYSENGNLIQIFDPKLIGQAF